MSFSPLHIIQVPLDNGVLWLKDFDPIQNTIYFKTSLVKQPFSLAYIEYEGTLAIIIGSETNLFQIPIILLQKLID